MYVFFLCSGFLRVFFLLTVCVISPIKIVLLSDIYFQVFQSNAGNYIIIFIQYLLFTCTQLHGSKQTNYNP